MERSRHYSLWMSDEYRRTNSLSQENDQWARDWWCRATASPSVGLSAQINDTQACLLSRAVHHVTELDALLHG